MTQPTTNNTEAPTMPIPAALRTAARRLRYLRRHPSQRIFEENDPQIKLGMTLAYEQALRLLIDEFGAQPEFHELFYGPQGEDADIQGNLLSN